jgi:hypothetical protein
VNLWLRQPGEVDENDDALLVEDLVVQEPCPPESEKMTVLYSEPPTMVNAALAAMGSTRRTATMPAT